MSTRQVYIECCEDCQNHSYYVSHRQEIYEFNYEQIKNNIQSQFNNIRVKKNIPYWYLKPLQQFQNQFNFVNRINNQKCKFPSLSSFEIVYNQILLYSKHQTETFPSINEVIKLIQILNLARKKDPSLFQYQNYKLKSQFLAKPNNNKQKIKSLYSYIFCKNTVRNNKFIQKKMNTLASSKNIIPYISYKQQEKLELMSQIYEQKNCLSGYFKISKSSKKYYKQKNHLQKSFRKSLEQEKLKNYCSSESLNQKILHQKNVLQKSNHDQNSKTKQSFKIKDKIKHSFSSRYENGLNDKTINKIDIPMSFRRYCPDKLNNTSNLFSIMNSFKNNSKYLNAILNPNKIERQLKHKIHKNTQQNESQLMANNSPKENKEKIFEKQIQESKQQACIQIQKNGGQDQNIKNINLQVFDRSFTIYQSMNLENIQQLSVCLESQLKQKQVIDNKLNAIQQQKITATCQQNNPRNLLEYIQDIQCFLNLQQNSKNNIKNQDITQQNNNENNKQNNILKSNLNQLSQNVSFIKKTHQNQLIDENKEYQNDSFLNQFIHKKLNKLYNKLANLCLDQNFLENTDITASLLKLKQQNQINVEYNNGYHKQPDVQNLSEKVQIKHQNGIIQQKQNQNRTQFEIFERAYITQKFSDKNNFDMWMYQNIFYKHSSFRDSQFSPQCLQLTSLCKNIKGCQLYPKNLRFFPKQIPKFIEQQQKYQHFLIQAINIIIKYDFSNISRLFQNPKILNKNGLYSIWLYNLNNRFEPIIIDDYFLVDTNNQPIYYKSMDGAIWLMLLQKAVAKLLGGYHNLKQIQFHKIFKILTGCPVIDTKTMNTKQQLRILDEAKNLNINKLIYGVEEQNRIERILKYSDQKLTLKQGDNTEYQLKIDEFNKKFKKISLLHFNPKFYFNQHIIPKSSDEQIFEFYVLQIDICQNSLTFMTLNSKQFNQNSKMTIFKQQDKSKYNYIGQIKRTGQLLIEYELKCGNYILLIESNFKRDCFICFYSQKKIKIKQGTHLNNSEHQYYNKLFRLTKQTKKQKMIQSTNNPIQIVSNNNRISKINKRPKLKSKKKFIQQQFFQPNNY